MRVFVEPGQLRAGEVEIRGEEHHYLAVARRSRPGDALELVDGTGRRAAATIRAITANVSVVIAGPVETSQDTPPAIRVLLPLIKGERMDFAIEKLVEVGATAIIVWPAARSVVKLDAKRRADRESHYGRAVQSAVRQCRRAITPAISIAESLDAAIAALPPGWRAVLDPTATRGTVPAVEPEIAIASGPEGGLDPSEAEVLAGAGFVPVGLGPRLLRAETAPMVAVAVLRASTDS